MNTQQTPRLLLWLLSSLGFLPFLVGVIWGLVASLRLDLYPQIKAAMWVFVTLEIVGIACVSVYIVMKRLRRSF